MVLKWFHNLERLADRAIVARGVCWQYQNRSCQVPELSPDSTSVSIRKMDVTFIGVLVPGWYYFCRQDGDVWWKKVIKIMADRGGRHGRLEHKWMVGRGPTFQTPLDKYKCR